MDVAACGGKAANLGRLIAFGIPVPEGVALTDDVLRSDSLPIQSLLSLMDGGPLIVRSSAIGEDGDIASFAGQLESIAGVRTEHCLRQAIAQVWASQHSPRVLAYQRLRNKPLAGMGVIVQRQIDARVSGVLFTESPVNTNEMLLEYSAGLGEALVQGEVDPGRIVIRRDDVQRWRQVAAPERTTSLTPRELIDLAQCGLSIERRFGHPQDIEWTIDNDGRLWIVQSRPITAAFSRIPAPRTAEPGNLAYGGSGHPGTVADLQSPGAAGTQVWSNANVNENFPAPISPLLYSIARLGYYHYFRNLGRAFGISGSRLARMEPALRQIIGVHGARMYYNLTSIHIVLRSAPFGDWLAASFNQFVGAENTAAAPAGAAYRARQAFEVLVIAIKTTWQYLFVTGRVARFERTIDAYAAATHPSRLPDKTQQELLQDFRDFIDIRCHRWTGGALADAGSMVGYGLLQRLLARAIPGRDQQGLHNTLLKALPDLVSGRPPVELWRLSRLIRDDRDLRVLIEHASADVVLDQVRTNPQFSRFRGAFDAFLDAWGFRCSSELMLTVPSFQEEPQPLIDLLRGYVASDAESPEDLLRRQAREREHETAAVMRKVRRRSLALWFALRTALGWTQRSIQLRERARLKQALLYSRLRRVALALGARLVDAGLLETACDIFLLTAAEVELLASGGEMFPAHVKALIALRRQAHVEVATRTPPDSFRLAAGAYYMGAAEDVALKGAHYMGAPEGASYTGIAACGGTSTACAAVLTDVTESQKLTPGDILVTRQTDPGWAPIFPLISGLVIERGGMLSHGAIVAREFGIPSVVGVKQATKRIAHRRRITVDGNRGVVYLDAGGA